MPSAWATGTPATAIPDTRSEATLAPRAPRRSTTRPAIRLPTTIGAVPANAATPVSAALPVDSRTNHGMATAAIVLPARDTALAATRARSGHGLGVVDARFSVTVRRIVARDVDRACRVRSSHAVA